MGDIKQTRWTSENTLKMPKFCRTLEVCVTLTSPRVFMDSWTGLKCSKWGRLVKWKWFRTLGRKLVPSPKELSSGLWDDALLRLWERLQQLGSHHGVSLPAACLPICHDAHIVAAGWGRRWHSSQCCLSRCFIHWGQRFVNVAECKAMVNQLCSLAHLAEMWGAAWPPRTLHPGSLLVHALWKETVSTASNHENLKNEIEQCNVHCSISFLHHCRVWILPLKLKHLVYWCSCFYAIYHHCILQKKNNKKKQGITK